MFSIMKYILPTPGYGCIPVQAAACCKAASPFAKPGAGIDKRRGSTQQLYLGSNSIYVIEQ